MSTYCTYVTFYSGNKLPPFYIGSTSTKRIDDGYRGSVCSKKYESIWKSEIKKNPNLFRTEIIETFENRKEALDHELFLQKENNVVKSIWFINMAFAEPDGCWGNSGEAHWTYGKARPRSTRRKISENHHDVSGANNPRARKIEIKDPNGTVHILIGGLKKFCKSSGLSYCTMTLKLRSNRKFNSGSSVGWSARYLD